MQKHVGMWTVFIFTLSLSQRSYAADEFESRCDDSVITAHLTDVINHLRQNPPPLLDPQQRTRRTSLLDRLEIYRDRGRFPRNTMHNYRSPIFLDDDGTACAVGQLLIDSSFAEVAYEISTTQNDAYIGEIDHPVVVKWAEFNGFTLHELAWIQPGYCGLTVAEYEYEQGWDTTLYSGSFSTDFVFYGAYTEDSSLEPPNQELSVHHIPTQEVSELDVIPGTVVRSPHSTADAILWLWTPSSELEPGNYRASGLGGYRPINVEDAKQPQLQVQNIDVQYRLDSVPKCICCNQDSTPEDRCAFTPTSWIPNVSIRIVVNNQLPVLVSVYDTQDPTNSASRWTKNLGTITFELPKQNVGDVCADVTLLDGNGDIFEVETICSDARASDELPPPDRRFEDLECPNSNSGCTSTPAHKQQSIWVLFILALFGLGVLYRPRESHQ